MTTKPRVKIHRWSIYYAGERGPIVTGVAENHPKLGTQNVWTSTIIRFDLDKLEAETLNTIYELQKSESKLNEN